MAAKPKRRKSRDDVPAEVTSIQAGGDVVGRDKLEAGGDIAGRGKITAGGHVVQAEVGLPNTGPGDFPGGEIRGQIE